MNDNPFLALFETSPDVATIDKSGSKIIPTNQTEAQVKINNFYERIFSFTVNSSKNGEVESVFSVIYLESLASEEEQNYLCKDNIGQAICERIFYDADDLKRLVRQSNINDEASSAEETRRVCIQIVTKDCLLNGQNSVVIVKSRLVRYISCINFINLIFVGAVPN